MTLPNFSLFYSIPFVGLLLSIATIPLIAPHFWHRNLGKVSAFWATLLLLLLFLNYPSSTINHLLLDSFFNEYLPFTILLSALFIISGGIIIDLGFRGNVLGNIAYLCCGALLAGWIGTMGASMLLIRPLLRANYGRYYLTHLMIFFVWIVGNIGGILTPLGDPPLLLGFLHGVDFFWPLHNLFIPMLLVLFPLLLLFAFIDSYYLRREINFISASHSFYLSGRLNIVLLLFTIFILFVSSTMPSATLSFYDFELSTRQIFRDCSLLGLGWVSWHFTSPNIHIENRFNWEPLLEVIKLFAGIFTTLIPVAAMLSQRHNGAFAPLLKLLEHSDGTPYNFGYFWITGVLSAFLDNAPTYLLFFHLAGGDPVHLMGNWRETLMAISCGAVFMGALSYIGNAPNLVISSVAKQHKILMPSFIMYFLISCLILGPLFALLSWIKWYS